MTDTMSVREVAKALGVSHQMVHKIEQRALQKARAILEEHDLTWEDFASEMRELEEYREQQGYDSELRSKAFTDL